MKISRLRMHLWPVVGAVLVAMALVVASATVPGSVLVFLLLLGVVAELVVYGALYLAERRRHW
jgi:hypothetical protein